MQNLNEIYYSSNLDPLPNPDLLFLSACVRRKSMERERYWRECRWRRQRRCFRRFAPPKKVGRADRWTDAAGRGIRGTMKCGNLYPSRRGKVDKVHGHFKISHTPWHTALSRVERRTAWWKELRRTILLDYEIYLQIVHHWKPQISFRPQ